MSLLVMVFLCLGVSDGTEPHVAAKKLMGSGDYDKAMVLLEKAVEDRSDWFYPRFLRGECQLKMGKYRHAVSDFLEAAGMDVPKEYEAPLFYYTARAYYGNEDYAKALQTYETSLKMMPPSRRGQIFLEMGDCHMRLADKSAGDARLKHLEDGVARLNDVFSEKVSKSSQQRAAYQRGHARLKMFMENGSQDQLQMAIKELDQWTRESQSDEKTEDLLLSLANRRLNLETDDAAKTAIYQETVGFTTRFLAKRPNDVDLLKQHAIALRGTGALDKADGAWTSLIEVGDSDGEALFWRGEGRIKQKRFSAGYQDLEQALAAGQKNRAEAWTLAAHALVSQKKGCYESDQKLYAKAETLLSDGLKAVPMDKQVQLDSRLSQIKQTRATLEENHKVELTNQANSLRNINALVEAIETNEAKLLKAKEQALSSEALAETLQERITEFQKVLESDREVLSQELKRVQSYIATAKQCGDAKTYPSLPALQAALKAHG